MEYIPWVEKYRPKKFEDIVLSPINKRLFNNIIEKKYFPNLLFYGPPGTGKTTTIINLINKFQKHYNQIKKSLVIHLNASDERGIDVIRNQIYQFVNTNTLFYNGIKFVILDEADFMTKNAQLALRYLVQQYSPNIRFCLICNYISRIDKALQNEFLRIRFCQLPQKNIYKFLLYITKQENLDINKNTLSSILTLFQSDLRSMINYLQSNQHNLKYYKNIISKKIWESTIKQVKETTPIESLKQNIITNCCQLNISVNNFIKKFISYIIHTKKYSLCNEWLSFFKNIYHADTYSDNTLDFFLLKLRSLYMSL